MGIQTPLLDFFGAHSNHLRNIVFISRKDHQGDTENQIRICIRTTVAVESEWRNRNRKCATERRSQTGRTVSVPAKTSSTSALVLIARSSYFTRAVLHAVSNS